MEMHPGEKKNSSNLPCVSRGNENAPKSKLPFWLSFPHKWRSLPGAFFHPFVPKIAKFQQKIVKINPG